MNILFLETGITRFHLYVYSQHYIFHYSLLKGHAQVKIIKKSVILFWLLNMTI